jgi:predicted ArsR family transcriptional regulator
MNATDTSTAAYDSIRELLNEKQRVVRSALKRCGPMTDKQIADFLGWEINRVTPRRGELGKMGALIDLGTVPGHTGRPVHLWKLKEEPVEAKAAITNQPTLI